MQKTSITFTNEQLEILKKLVEDDKKDIFSKDEEEKEKILLEIKFGLIKIGGLNK